MARFSVARFPVARFSFCARIALSLLAAGCASAANAQTYPNKPIRVVVAIAAGSVTDVIMRAAANELSPRLGQQLVIAPGSFHPKTAAARHCSQPREQGFAFIRNTLWPKRTCSACHHNKTAVAPKPRHRPNQIPLLAQLQNGMLPGSNSAAMAEFGTR